MMTEKYFIGADVGGTNIQTALVHPSGQIVRRYRATTPPGAPCEEILQTIIASIRQLLDEASNAGVSNMPQGKQKLQVGGIGLAVPGLVEYEHNRIAKSPNMAISGHDLVEPVSRAIDGVDVTLANDCDAAVLGERWLGAARTAESVVGIFVGTGIGGGILVDGQLLRTPKYSIGEVGHICLELDGPLCGCGNHGCFEALASRTAIERRLRASIDSGVDTILSEWIEPGQMRIRSGMLLRALEAGDGLVTRVLGRAADVIGHACVTLRHLLEPELFVFGGGVIEACGDFMFPRIEGQLRGDPFLVSRESPRVLLSALGDDAGVLGAAAIAMDAAGLNPLTTSYDRPVQAVPVQVNASGEVQVGDRRFDRDMCVRVDGRAKPLLKKSEPKSSDVKTPAGLTPRHLKRVCKGGPQRLLIAHCGGSISELSSAADSYLTRRAIDYAVLETDDAIQQFNADNSRIALLVIT